MECESLQVIIWNPTGTNIENGERAIFEEMRAEHFPEIIKNSNPQIRCKLD